MQDDSVAPIDDSAACMTQFKRASDIRYRSAGNTGVSDVFKRSLTRGLGDAALKLPLIHFMRVLTEHGFKCSLYGKASFLPFSLAQVPIYGLLDVGD
ncbi:hypothetical protein [Burkholderia diffusa]|uniref:hypothetical protein n=1 Tax=Burkholderia diffusa TaxID=488732 RepID=UPI002AB0DEDD|nr:hypothetical protein [Burkholderia diffusa]